MKILFYSFPNGNQPVKQGIEQIIDKKLRVKTMRTIQLLQQYGTELTMPYCEYLGKYIWQLRVTYSSNNFRILYFCIGDCAVLTNSYIKKTNKTPQCEIDKAINRMKDYRERIKYG